MRIIRGRAIILAVIPALICLVFAGSIVKANSVQLITNGGFETGDLTGWSEFDQSAADSGPRGWFVSSDTGTPLHPTVGAASGTFYALSDQTFGPGADALIQSFTVPVGAKSVVLSFNMFVNDWAGIVAGCGTLDYTVVPSQCSRVDILTSGSAPFSTTTGVVDNLYMGSDPFGSNPNPYTLYSFNLTGALTPGTTYQLRFAEVDNQSYFNPGVDDVTITVTTPEPTSLLLFGTGLAVISRIRNRKRKS